jgi:hypothetical protein
VDGENVGVVESRGCLRLLLEAREPIRITRDKRWQYLDRHFALQRGVTSAIDLSHPAGSEQGENFIAVEFRACGQRHGHADYIAETEARCNAFISESLT